MSQLEQKLDVEELKKLIVAMLGSRFRSPSERLAESEDVSRGILYSKLQEFGVNMDGLADGRIVELTVGQLIEYCQEHYQGRREGE